MSNPTTIAQWLQSLPIGWLVAGPNGSADVKSYGSVIDGQLALLKAGIKARFPDTAPTDALPHIGGDRLLVQGPTESNSNFITRIKTAWGNSPITVPAPGLPTPQPGGPRSGWSLAGTALQLLEELYWGGFSGAVIVQQNGLAYNLSGAPTAGADNSGLLVITPTGALTAPLVSTVNPSRSIPAGTPWFAFDGNTDLCNRFAVLFPGPTLPSAFRTFAVANFSASDNAAITWNNAFIDTTYVIQPGVAVPTDGSGPVFISVDGTTKTTTGVTIRASAPFTGTCTVLAYQAGANPLADLHPADLARLQLLIKTWRPNALCMGVFALTGGEMWDYPIGLTWDGDSNTWDQGSAASVQFLGVF